MGSLPAGLSMGSSAVCQWFVSGLSSVDPRDEGRSGIVAVGLVGRRRKTSKTLSIQRMSGSSK